MNSMKLFVYWMKRNALPAWSALGYDTTHDRFWERLDAMGAPLHVPHRAMVQARQIYVFATAQYLGWCDSGAYAERAMFSLIRDFCNEDVDEAHFAFSVSLKGHVVSDVCDAYTHAFILFAIAALYELNGNRRLLRLAHKVNTMIKRRLTDPVHGGLFDSAPADARGKRQNPVMHLLEAYLALERVAPDSGFLDDATRLVSLFTTRLFPPARRVLFEQFNEDWSLTGGNVSRVFEPGHHFEWVWLLHDYAVRSGESVGDVPTRLYEIALQHGINAAGLIHDELDANFLVVKSSHRLWPHTEAIKAASAQHRAADAGATAVGEQSARTLLGHFLNRPFHGGWIDHIDSACAPIVGYVPASSLYHLFFAATEAVRSFGGPATFSVVPQAVGAGVR